MLVVTSNYNAALLPVADFFGDSVYTFPNGTLDDLFDLCDNSNFIIAQGQVIVRNNSVRYDSIQWTFSDEDSTKTFITNTVQFSFDNLWGSSNWYQNLYVCLTAYIQFGSSTKCDTICHVTWEGIDEISLASIKLYPSPANAYIFIDMTQNQDEITRNYTAIEIYNAIGEKAKVISERNNRMVNVSVADMPEGMYMATIVDAKGTRRTLGRFSVMH